MKVSLNTIKQFTDVHLSVDELITKINSQLGGVEDIINLGERYKDAVIVKVVSAEQHPNADRLRVTKIDDGGVCQNVERDENGYVQVVCGAPNARAGILAVWLPPESTVPSSYTDKELFVLGSRELRGVMSHGMLAAADELAIGSDHDGIVEIDASEWKPSDVDIKPGTSFASAYGLDDHIIDIENKMFTHRPDLFGQLGVAREIAGIQHQKFISPDWYKDLPEFKPAKGLELEVFNDNPEKISRFMVVAIKDVEVKPSPLWLQCALTAMGSKPINNIVDVTNYIMLLTAQPVHAYDYDKLPDHEIGARLARKDETVSLLNHKTYELSQDDIVIASGKGAIGLAGIMGGSNSEVSSDTKNIVLEVATFDMYTVRKSSMRHGVFTDALTRFNKGQSPLQNPYVMHLLMQSIHDIAGGEQASEVYDKSQTAARSQAVEITPHFINERLGLHLSTDEIISLLTNVEWSIKGTDRFEVRPPFWRTDIELPEDIVEEVGRLYGFDKLPRELPTRSMKPAAKNPRLEAKRLIRDSLSRAGASEVVTYSFVHEKVLQNAGQDPGKAYKLGNALSPDLQYYRLSLLPSLIDKVHANIRSGHDEFALFELGKSHKKGELDDEDLPKEFDRIALVYAADKKVAATKDGAPYFAVRTQLEHLYSDMLLGENLSFQKLADCEFLTHPMFAELAVAFEPERAAAVYVDGKLSGVVGEFKQSVQKKFKLPDYAAGFELFLTPFLTLGKKSYQPLSKFPTLTQDISLKVDYAVAYKALFDTAHEALDGTEATKNTRWTLEPVAIYAPVDSSAKTITLRLKVTADDRTLKDSDVTPLLDHLATVAAEQLDVIRV